MSVKEFAMKRQYLTPELKFSNFVSDESISIDEIQLGSFANEWNEVDDIYKSEF